MQAAAPDPRPRAVEAAGDGTGGLDAPTPLANFAIDRSAEVPIGVQLAWALRARIRDGSLAPGGRLPGLRDLAESLRINANTVRAVYARLEQEGLLDSRQGSGTFVASDVPRPRPHASAIAAGAAYEALRSGVDPREVAAALYVVADRRDGTPASVDAETSRRVRLRSQIAALEQTLSELEAEYPDLARRASEPRRQSFGEQAAAARLPSATELEQTRLELVRRLTCIQPLIDVLEGEGSATAERAADEHEEAAPSAKRGRQPGAVRRVGKRPPRPATAGT